ncbi:MAG: hypothetical protein WBA74_02045 [Cyclobacteriaceae bacterium]
MRSIFKTFLFIVLFGCSNGTTENKSKSADLSVSKQDKIENQSQQDSSSRFSLDIKLLQGVWAESEDQNALFTIKGDSLYYFEDPKPVYYELTDDTLKILIEGEFYSSKILKLSSDSLIRKEYGNVVRLYKR